MGKKIWEKPQLVVMVRNKPEEGVLSSCKLGYPLYLDPSYPNANRAGCCFGACPQCSDRLGVS